MSLGFYRQFTLAASPSVANIANNTATALAVLAVGAQVRTAILLLYASFARPFWWQFPHIAFSPPLASSYLYLLGTLLPFALFWASVVSLGHRFFGLRVVQVVLTSVPFVLYRTFHYALA